MNFICALIAMIFLIGISLDVNGMPTIDSVIHREVRYSRNQRQDNQNGMGPGGLSGMCLLFLESQNAVGCLLQNVFLQNFD